MLCRYKIKPLSPLITPLMSDTFFGHFCWALRYERGESFLMDFLDSYGDGKSAPVIFSSAVVSGRLQRPVLPPLHREQTRRFVEEKFINDNSKMLQGMTDRQKAFSGMNLIKAWNKLEYLSIDQWKRLKDDYSELRVLETFLERYKSKKGLRESTPYELEVTASNTISRTSGTVTAESGGLFQREKIWYHKGSLLDLYVDINSEEMLSAVSKFLTDFLPGTGFGADKTIGMGELAITRDNTFEPDHLKGKSPNAHLSLSLASFPGIEKYNAFYRLKTKFGKLGGDFAVSSPTGGNPRPFKKPVLMYEPGAVFLCNEDLSNKSLLENIHSDKRIRHCGIPVTLPFKISEDISYANIAA